MKCVMVFALCAVAVSMTKTIDHYKTGNEHLDMDALIADHKKLQSFLDCFADRAPCSELLESYKKVIPGALEQTCARCTDNQKYMFWRFLVGVKMVYPQQYEEFRNHYDPENKYFDALEKEISKYTKPSFY